ncbi:HNH endonuclease signature motif containing protein [uncultured Ornithinimicrobium sp.]|uniref:HNH endonuclease n=1 Tax=uncultured Ornithinimicrobium sp. TaxID=259307 RepID=UPI00338DB0C2
MSNQGTVLTEWVKAVAEAMDIPYAGKVRTVRAILESLGVEWNATTMASETTRSEGGGNISTPGFQALLTALENSPRAQPRRRLNQGRAPFPPPDPGASQDTEAWRALRVRRGQRRFRASLLQAYGGRCAVTGCDAEATLEAAHITPYGEGGTYETRNGLLLRADIHTLFDLQLVAVDGRRILLHHELLNTTYERELEGVRLRLPRRATDHPDVEGLRAHRMRCGF